MFLGSSDTSIFLDIVSEQTTHEENMSVVIGEHDISDLDDKR